jgi:hypothetical protein
MVQNNQASDILQTGGYSGLAKESLCTRSTRSSRQKT